MIKFVGALTEQQMTHVAQYLENRLHDEEKKRIYNENFYVSIIAVPVSNIFYRGNPFKNLSDFNLITVTYNFYKKYIPEEIAAVILHEVGHIINRPNSDSLEDKEFYADDYSRKCSFGKELLANLELAIKDEFDEAKIELMKNRIERMKNNADLLLNLKD